MGKLDIQKLAAFCKDNGLIFPSGEIYGGFAGFWDYGPRGVELKENIKRSWWRRFVHSREDVAGIDGAIITNPRVWVASGHAKEFVDYVVFCKKCRARYRAEHLIEDILKIPSEDLSRAMVEKLLTKIKCPKCGRELAKPRAVNLMFETNVGIEGERSYLRPETAQLIFTNFRLVQETARMKLPFGIAQIGKAFRNEISPRNFLFRSREFEQMEIEYFVHPEKIGECAYLKGAVLKRKMNVIWAGGKRVQTLSLKDFVNRGIAPWLAYWISEMYDWILGLGIRQENLRIREHSKEELAHYASACWDIEYNFPFGWKEIVGVADRGNFDLNQHIKYSGKNLGVFDEESGKHIVPAVAAEPSLGVDRIVLALLFDSFHTEIVRGEKRVVLRLKPELAPVQVAVFPLLRRDGLPKLALQVFNYLKDKFVCFYDEVGSIGRRYRRQDEIGTPYCITIDHQTLKDQTVTIRFRDSMRQVRVKWRELSGKLKF